MGFPNEPWPAVETIEALDGTTDEATGLNYVALGTRPNSSPPLAVQVDRMLQRLNTIVGAVNQLRVVRIDTTHIGIFPGYFRIAGSMYHYPGEASIEVSAAADTYYIYLTADSDEGGAGTATLVADGDDWPADGNSYVPVASFTVVASAIASITDLRSYSWYSAGVSAMLAAIGALTPTDGNIIVGDGSTFVAESGATARTSLGVAIGSNVQAWNAALDAIAALAKTDGNIIVGDGTTWVAESGATARTSLGLAIGSNVQAWNAALDAIAALAKTDGNIIVGDGTTWVAESGATALASLGAQAADADLTLIAALTGEGIAYRFNNNTWDLASIGSEVQAWAAILDAIAALSAAGVIARTGDGTVAARTVTAGSGISVSNGDGVSGNPTVAVDTGGITPTMLHADISEHLPYASMAAGTQTGQTKTISIKTKSFNAADVTARMLLRVWISDTAYGAPNATGHTVANVDTQIRELTANADYEIITDASGEASFDLTDSDGGTWYVMCANGAGGVNIVNALEVVIAAP